MAVSPELLAKGAEVAQKRILGSAQLFGGLIGKRKGTKEVNKLLSGMPMAEEDTGIMSYYNQALQRAGVSPTSSALYKGQLQNIGQSGATAMRGLQQQRGGLLGGSSSIMREANKAKLDALMGAEQQQSQRFSALGPAAQAAAAERRRVFEMNKMRPWSTRLGMAAQRAASGAETANIGLSNIFGG